MVRFPYGSVKQQMLILIEHTTFNQCFRIRDWGEHVNKYQS